jgi:adenosylcobinamide-GDP ribazoletransferase
LRELKVLYACIQFYTRIPLPALRSYSNDHLQNSIRYLPLIGLLVGCIGSVVFVLTNLFLPFSLSLVLSLASMALVTGGMHEDGFADCCDGFGGGYTSSRILEIMKDSHIGVFGVLGLIFLIGIKFSSLNEIGSLDIPLLLISAHILSRILPILMVYTSKYVRPQNQSKAGVALPLLEVDKDQDSRDLDLKDQNATQNLLTTNLGLNRSIPFSIIAFYCSPLLFFFPIKTFLFMGGTLILVFFSMRWYCLKKINGYTGDVLGAMQQVGEVSIYISYLAIENF